MWISAPVTTQYSYDGVNRLWLASEAGTSTTGCPANGSRWCQKYFYDERGNRTIVERDNTGIPLAEPTAFGTDNRITSPPGYEYDSRGNIKTVPVGLNGERYAYDGENRQVGFCRVDTTCPTTPGPGRVQYGYDGEGRRVTKTDQTGSIVYVYDARGRLAAEYGGYAGSGVQYVTPDHLGSTRVITDPAKAVVECSDFLPFGDEILASTLNGRSGIACYSADLTRQKFTGKERDSESRL